MKFLFRDIALWFLPAIALGALLAHWFWWRRVKIGERVTQTETTELRSLVSAHEHKLGAKELELAAAAVDFAEMRRSHETTLLAQQARASRLAVDLEENRSVLVGLRGDLERQAAELSNAAVIGAERDQLAAELEALRNQLGAANQRIETSQREVERVAAETAAVQADLATTRTMYQTSRAEVSSLRGELDRVRTSVDTGRVSATAHALLPSGADGPVLDVPVVDVPVVEQTGPTEGDQGDHLEVIEGVGPRAAAALHAFGIHRFIHLHAATEDELREAIERAGIHFAPSIGTWAAQAGYLVRGDEAGFRADVERLVGGIRPTPC